MFYNEYDYKRLKKVCKELTEDQKSSIEFKYLNKRYILNKAEFIKLFKKYCSEISSIINFDNIPSDAKFKYSINGCNYKECIQLNNMLIKAILIKM